MADRPARLNARVNASAVVLICALASSIGADGSKARSPKLKLLAMVTMLKPVGIGQYAPGSSSCAGARAGSTRSAKTAAVQTRGNVVTTYGCGARRIGLSGKVAAMFQIAPSVDVRAAISH